MPAASTTARTAPPAITPVPSGAGLSRTRPAPNSPMTSWGMVVPVQGDGDDVLLCVLKTLADCLGNFARLAEAVADAALAVANDAQRGELHDAAALDGLADAVEGNYLLDELGGSLVLATISSVIIVCHYKFSPFLRTSGRPHGRPLPVPSRGRDKCSRRGRTRLLRCPSAERALRWLAPIFFAASQLPPLPSNALLNGGGGARGCFPLRRR